MDHRKINKVKNLAGLLDLASVPQYQNGGKKRRNVSETLFDYLYDKFIKSDSDGENFNDKSNDWYIGEDNYKKLIRVKNRTDTTTLKNTFDLLRNLGYDRNSNIAINANIGQESEWRPNVKQYGGGGGRGLFQFTSNARLIDLDKFKQNYDYSNDTTNMPYFPGKLDILYYNDVWQDELDGKHHSNEWLKTKDTKSYRDVINIMKGDASIHDKVNAVQNGYLRPGKPHNKTRQKLGQILDEILPDYAEGGIHIKKKNRGKFTETMKRTGKTAEELKHSKNPLTRKRATFAINARKWAKKK